MRALAIGLMAAMVLVPCVASGQVRRDGEMVAKVTGVERTRIHGEPFTACALVVFCDSSYVGDSVRPGEAVQAWTAGGECIAFLDGPDGPIRTVPVVSGEKVFVYYRFVGDMRLIVDKWTVWKKGVSIATGTKVEREQMKREDMALETMLARDGCHGSVQDSLALYCGELTAPVMTEPNPRGSATWQDYGLLTKWVGTLGEIRKRVAARYRTR